MRTGITDIRRAWANIRAYPGRFAAVLLAISIGVGFTVTTVVFTESFRTDLVRSIGAAPSKVDVLVFPFDAASSEQPASEQDPPQEPAATPSVAEQLATMPGIATIEPIYRGAVQFATESARGWLAVETIPDSQQLRWFDLESGSWPTGLDQVAVDPGTAERNGLTIGGVLPVVVPGGTSRSVTIVGILDLQRSSLGGAQDAVFAAPALAGLLAGHAWEIDLLAAPGISADELRAQVSAALGDRAEVQTGAAVVELQANQVLGDTGVLAAVLLTFAAIAGVVAAFVIANTFTILVTQRQRQIGLLRCVGASRRQVRRSLLAEAGLIGLIGALAGVLLGVVMALVTMAVVNISFASLTIPVIGVVVAVAVGMIVTVLAALAPAVRAMRVSPLAALSPVPTVAEATSAGRVRLVVGGLLIVAGVAAMVGGVLQGVLLLAVAGGAVSAGGVLILLRTWVPPLITALRAVARRSGVVGRLAAANLERHPQRAASTTGALVIAVGLIVMLQVATAGARASITTALAGHYPLDVSVTATSGSGDRETATLPAGLTAQLSGVEGLTTIEIAGTTAALTSGDAEFELPVLGVPTGIDAIVRAGTLAEGSIAVPSWMLSEEVAGTTGVRVGDQLTLARGSVRLTLTVADSRLADGQGQLAVIAAGDLARLDPAAVPAAIWGRLDDAEAADEAISRINRVLAPYASLQLGGAAADRVAVDSALSTALGVLTSLLAVAAVIAVVGIGNTLALSVVERTRESALLRALGLHRRQLRWMLAAEAALLAAIGAVIGIVIGTVYGLVGTAATFGQVGEAVTLAFPIGQVLLVLVLALVAGVAASVLPARRAAAAHPTEALAEV